MRARVALRSLGLAVLLALLAACGSDAPRLKGMVQTPPLEVAAVRLPSAPSGTPVAMQAPPDELYLVYFGYTSCPDICPTTMSDLRVALDDLPDDLAARVTVAMVTVDPDRDTGEVLSGYLGHFFDRSLALRTADATELRQAADVFGVQWEVEAHEPGEPYGVSHTAITYVVDDTGTVVVQWPFNFDTRSMTSDLRTLLREEQP